MTTTTQTPLLYRRTAARRLPYAIFQNETLYIRVCDECDGAGSFQSPVAGIAIDPCDCCDGIGGHDIRPELPCIAPRGNLARVMVYQKRYADGLPIFDDRDAREDTERRPPGYVLEFNATTKRMELTPDETLDLMEGLDDEPDYLRD